MHLKKRLSLLAVAAVAVGLLAVPAGASASDGQCAFTGVTGSINPGVMLVGGGGNYTFATSDPQTTQCRHNGDGPRNSRIESKGSFTNTVCGTGKATGSSALPSDTRVDVGANGTWDIDNIQYHIDFTAAQGQLHVHSIQGRPETGSEPDGHVTIVPTGGSCSAATGVTQFTVAGAFNVTW
ncbi:MAG TPA: hypothetical protein VGW10_03450 [Solirubrobacteraceae bacterium]|nr:hypothetical protein [Solirubrobacteraceae bacterium]